MQDADRNADIIMLWHGSGGSVAPHLSTMKQTTRGTVQVGDRKRVYNGVEMNEITPDTKQTPMVIRDGIHGATSISMQRRVRDSRFATRYLVGNGIDVGAGGDPLALYREFFPLIQKIVKYDRPQGNAQTLENVRDGTFDFLYSSHCLEHLVDPVEGLRNWIRVVRPGGYLVVAVPDEDLYEQGVWPSTFNTDHKHTFTLCKKKSWSPVSINLFDMLGGVADLARPISVETVDHGFRKQLTIRFDQTRTPLAESSIEFVLLKY